jgi:hypothetical protein
MLPPTGDYRSIPSLPRLSNRAKDEVVVVAKSVVDRTLDIAKQLRTEFFLHSDGRNSWENDGLRI